ncbi:hypothetical protein JZ751_019493 [Albula glossodonta]|uniref:Globin domain-containing protein n=1 Tax=Albula glossodonta TaxID=121402 RepID=A0A8T2N454_9TELE|nr:hypothetical protein JZ751_019493 [Albula glossodonta]
MVEWTEAERKAIASLWGQLNPDEIGPQALASGFGDLSTPAAIMGNAKVAQHGKTVMNGLDRAVKNLDNIKDAYSDLSKKHSETLHVDPDNFRLFAEIVTACVAAKLGGSKFNPGVHEAWQKFLSVVVFALGRQYH